QSAPRIAAGGNENALTTLALLNSFNPPPALLRGETGDHDRDSDPKTCFNPPPALLRGETVGCAPSRWVKSVSIRPPHCCGGKRTARHPLGAPSSFNPPPALLRGETAFVLK